MIQKNNIRNIFKSCLLFGLCTFLAACTQTVKKDTIRLANSSGVSEQSIKYSSYDPSSAIPDDDPEGRIPALEALAKENPGAAYDLGLHYFRGDGIAQNSYKALQWMRNAAERGDLEAQKAVGKFYLTGMEEMGEDLQEAEKWLRMAAGQGDKEAKKLLKEVTKSKLEYSRWREYWGPRYYHSWRYGYRYRGYWRGGGWYYH